MTTTSTQRVDIHHAITQQIISAIEQGTGPVIMPWHRSGAGITRPKNVHTGNAYRGINTVALWAAASRAGYASGLWGTYRQWQECGAQVRKGETSSLIVFYKELEREETPTPIRPHWTAGSWPAPPRVQYRAGGRIHPSGTGPAYRSDHPDCGG